VGQRMNANERLDWGNQGRIVGKGMAASRRSLIDSDLDAYDNHGAL
jgi:hypothetical protein